MSVSRALPSVVCITGTGTGVGKTVATAALATLIRARGTQTCVIKVAQSGVAPGEPGDVGEVRALVGADLETVELLRLTAPLAPDSAARHEGVALPPVATHAKVIAELAAQHPVVLVEGSGGLLVRLDGRGGTLADIGIALRYKGISCGFVLVATAGLGTLNSAALTAEALQHRGLPLLGTVIGDWPAEPGLAEQSNLIDLPAVTGAPLLGRIPMGSGALTAEAFGAGVPTWMDLS